MAIAENRPTHESDDDIIEIRLSDVVSFLKRSRFAVLIGIVMGLVIGVAYALSLPDEYTSQVTVLPEIQTKGAGGLGNLSSLAGLAGINLDNISSSTEAIRPDLYPNVLQSLPFALFLLNQKTPSEEFGTRISLSDYLNRREKSGFTFNLFSFMNDESPKSVRRIAPDKTGETLQLTKQQEDQAKQIQKQVSATFDKKTGIITVSATMPDPIVAATAATTSLHYLRNYVINYRTGKASRQVQFLQQQVNQAKRRYEGSERILSNYRDRNKGLYLNTAKLEEQRLQADFLLAQSLYTDLSKQLEQAKIKVAEDAPVFQVLEPAKVPLKKSGPKRAVIIGGISLLGCLVGLGLFGLLQFRKSLRVG